MDFASITICTFLQPGINFLQSALNFMYLPLSFFGISAPPVHTWFQPLVSCTLT
jgi:hypothetical protein